MPAVSKKQERFMQAVAHNPAFAKKVGVPVKVGKEFTKSGGGKMKESKAMVKKEVAFMKKKGAPKSMIKHEMKEAGMKKMASGGLAAGHKAADGIAKKGKTKGKEVKMAMGGAAMGAVRNAAAAPKQFLSDAIRSGAAKQQAPQAAPKQFLSNAIRSGSMKPSTGGMMGGGSQMPKIPQMRKSMAGLGAAVAGKMMGKKAGGLAAGHKEADGIAKKGKTRAMQVKMAGGGKTKKYC
jgi:hypothetical protein